jgi:diguanylate cyclase (GGDEF)-like protein/PAS domain S-box-containing protein
LTPHGFCLLWQPGLIALHAASDLLTAGAYFSIPLALIALVNRRRDIAYSGMILLFAAFIVGCGLSHVMAVVTLWQPAYWLEGAVKAGMAAISVATAFLLWPMIPVLAALPSPSALQATIASMKVAQADLSVAKKRLELAQRMGSIGNFHHSLTDNTLTWSEEMFAIFGYNPLLVTPTFENMLACVCEGDRERVIADVKRATETCSGFEHRVAITRPGGEIRHIAVRGHVQMDGRGMPACIFGVVMDRTDEQERKNALQTALEAAEKSEQRYRLLAENVSDVVVSLDASLTFVSVSPSSLAVTGYRPGDLMGRPLRNFIAAEDWNTVQSSWASLCAGHLREPLLFRFGHRKAGVIWLEASGRLLPDGSSVILSMRDVTGRVAAEDGLLSANLRLEAISRTDCLTGLANRRGFDEFLAREVQRCTLHRLPISLILIDVDLFKTYNDRYGHLAGDACLKMIAQIIAGYARRQADLAARYGGEELAMVLPGVDLQKAFQRAEMVRNAIEKLGVEHSGAPAGRVTASFGVAAFMPDSETGSGDLFATADRLLYEAKRRGRNMVLSDAMLEHA